MSTNKDRIEFALIMGRETKATAFDVQQIMRMSVTHARLCETMCNRELTTKEQTKLERLKTGFTTWAKRIDGCVGFCLSQDPRGCTVKAVLRSGVTNDWAKEGVCVPQ